MLGQPFLRMVDSGESRDQNFSNLILTSQALFSNKTERKDQLVLTFYKNMQYIKCFDILTAVPRM